MGARRVVCLRVGRQGQCFQHPVARVQCALGGLGQHHAVLHLLALHAGLPVAQGDGVLDKGAHAALAGELVAQAQPLARAAERAARRGVMQHHGVQQAGQCFPAPGVAQANAVGEVGAFCHPVRELVGQFQGLILASPDGLAPRLDKENVVFRHAAQGVLRGVCKTHRVLGARTLARAWYILQHQRLVYVIAVVTH